MQQDEESKHEDERRQFAADLRELADKIDQDDPEIGEVCLCYWINGFVDVPDSGPRIMFGVSPGGSLERLREVTNSALGTVERMLARSKAKRNPDRADRARRKDRRTKRLGGK